MRSLSLLVIASALAACSTTMEPTTRSAEAQAQLDKLLAGKVAGTPVACLPQARPSANMVSIDDNTIAFRQGSRVYINHPSGGCSNLGGSFALVTRTPSTRLCRGDIAEVTDLRSGFTVGSCTLGDFVPFNKPGA